GSSASSRGEGDRARSSWWRSKSATPPLRQSPPAPATSPRQARGGPQHDRPLSPSMGEGPYLSFVIPANAGTQSALEITAPALESAHQPPDQIAHEPPGQRPRQVGGQRAQAGRHSGLRRVRARLAPGDRGGGDR